MRLIPLQATANQQLSFTQDGNRWVVTIKQAVTSMIADVSINEAVIISGVRIMGDDFVLPYPYIGIEQGNLMLTVEQDALPDWQQFTATQRLYYWTPDEMRGLNV